MFAKCWICNYIYAICIRNLIYAIWPGNNQHAFRNAISCGPNDVPLVCSYFPWQSFHSSQPFPCSKPYLIERTALRIVRGFDVEIALGKNIVSEYLVRGPQTHVIERTALNIVRGLDVKITLSRDESFIRIQWNQISPLPS